ncbi:hypothetical protein CC2G_008870 [Coprinopsis cinerea AmutBmut pab1-1]|nr:hypothetical protein CC2G_008870 [Coprinopsis cinerea AmutBmut pab1-1]
MSLFVSPPGIQLNSLNSRGAYTILRTLLHPIAACSPRFYEMNATITLPVLKSSLDPSVIFPEGSRVRGFDWTPCVEGFRRPSIGFEVI